MKIENLEKAKLAQAEFENAIKQSVERLARSCALASGSFAKEIATLFETDCRNTHAFRYSSGAEGFCKAMEEQIPIYRKAIIDATKTAVDESSGAKAAFYCALSKL